MMMLSCAALTAYNRWHNDGSQGRPSLALLLCALAQQVVDQLIHTSLWRLLCEALLCDQVLTQIRHIVGALRATWTPTVKPCLAQILLSRLCKTVSLAKSSTVWEQSLVPPKVPQKADESSVCAVCLHCWQQAVLHMSTCLYMPAHVHSSSAVSLLHAAGAACSKGCCCLPVHSPQSELSLRGPSPLGGPRGDPA